MNRRELLTGFLGFSAAWGTGCGRGAPRLPESGEIVGASEAIGHRIRDGARPTPAADQWEQTDVVIVGGGVAGLSAARQLRKASCDRFVLLELETQPGGTSRSGTNRGLAHPWGAHYLPVPMAENVALIDLLDEMSLLEGRDDQGAPIVAEQFLCRDPEERLFADGIWHEGLFPDAITTADDRQQFAAFQNELNHWVAWRDARGRRAFAIPVTTASDDVTVTELDRYSMAEWLAEHRFTSPRLHWLVDYACRDDYGLTVAHTSAWAGLFYFASRVREPGTEAQPLMTWPEGNGRLVAHMSHLVKDRVRLGFAVTEVIPVTTEQHSGVDVIACNHDQTVVRGWHARRVIFAAPQFLARHLVREYRNEGPAAAAEFSYGAWMVANLHLEKRPREPGFPLAWDNVIADSPSLGYVVSTHQQGIDHGPTVWTYYYPLCEEDSRAARQRLLSLGWSEWAEIALSDLERAHPDLRPLVQRLDVMRWGHAMVRPHPGFLFGGGRDRCRQTFRNVHFAHSDLSGIPLFEEAFDQGNRAAAEVLRDLRQV